MHCPGQSTLFDLTSDRAKGETFCMARHVTVDGEARQVMIAALRYTDSFVKQEGAWRFAERLLFVVWSENRAMR